MTFCTLFNVAYMDKGLVMYKSLEQVSNDFTLYVLAMDEQCYDILSTLNYPHLKPIKLNEFETPELLEVKKVRSFGEYCWTCSSSLIAYILDNYKTDHCTYIDADLYFYSDPSVLLNEMEEKQASVLIVGHRFNNFNKKVLAHKVGTYCVQFNTFKNDINGRKLLNIWQKQCIEYCSCDGDGIHWADQKYMDNWVRDYNFVIETQHYGAGVAPWNIAQYKYIKKDSKNSIIVKIKRQEIPIIFYHFENIQYIEAHTININVYNAWTIDSKLVDTLYYAYLRKIDAMKEYLKKEFGIDIIIRHHPGIIQTQQTIFNKLKKKLQNISSIPAIKTYIMSVTPERFYKKRNIIHL